jgi:hypothetical protein
LEGKGNGKGTESETGQGRSGQDGKGKIKKGKGNFSCISVHAIALFAFCSVLSRLLEQITCRYGQRSMFLFLFFCLFCLDEWVSWLVCWFLCLLTVRREKANRRAFLELMFTKVFFSHTTTTHTNERLNGK